MKNVWLLLKIQLSALLGFNKILHLQDKAERRKKLAAKIALCFCYVLLLPCFGMYAFIMGEGLNALGQIDLFPGFMLAAGCLMTLITSVSLANGTLFAYKDYDLIASLPVKNWQIALSRLLLGYVFITVLDFFIMIPCGAVYAYFVRPAWGYYPVFVVTMLAAPVVPMIVGALIGIIAARLTAHLKGAKYFRMLGSMILCFGIMSVGWRMDALMEGGVFGDIGAMLSGLMVRIYPMTPLYISSIRDLNPAAAGAFTGISLIALAAMAYLMGRFMRQINTALATTRAGGRFRLKSLNTASPLAALYKKELRRYTSSVIWLFNTAFGLVLAIIGVGALAIKGRDTIGLVLAMLEITGMDNRMIVYAIGYIGAFMVTVSCTTPCAISMEGRNLWLIQSLPVSGFHVLAAKMMVSLTLTVPTSVVIGLGVGLTLRLEAAEMAAITSMALSYSLMSAALGLLLNLKSHNFEWTTEAAVVKQSASVGISMMIDMALVIGPAVLTFWLAEYATLVFYGTTALMALIGAGLMILFRIRGDRMIRNL